MKNVPEDTEKCEKFRLQRTSVHDRGDPKIHGILCQLPKQCRAARGATYYAGETHLLHSASDEGLVCSGPQLPNSITRGPQLGAALQSFCPPGRLPRLWA